MILRAQVVITWVLVASISSSLAAIPNGSLRVAYRQKEEGQLSEGVHQIELTCFDGACSLTTLTLNQCMPYLDGKAFAPKVERTSTREGDLTVREVEPGVLIAEESHGPSTFKYRFTYKVHNDPDGARLMRLREARFFDGLTKFSGAAVKQSAVLDKVVTWELVPIKGYGTAIEAKCKILVDGVPE